MKNYVKNQNNTNTKGRSYRTKCQNEKVPWTIANHKKIQEVEDLKKKSNFYGVVKSSKQIHMQATYIEV